MKAGNRTPLPGSKVVIADRAVEVTSSERVAVGGYFLARLGPNHIGGIHLYGEDALWCAAGGVLIAPGRAFDVDLLIVDYVQEVERIWIEAAMTAAKDFGIVTCPVAANFGPADRGVTGASYRGRQGACEILKLSDCLLFRCGDCRSWGSSTGL